MMIARMIMSGAEDEDEDRTPSSNQRLRLPVVVMTRLLRSLPRQTAILAAVMLQLRLLLLASIPPISGHEISFRALEGKHVLVVGGSGRVGGSVVTQLVRRRCQRVTVAGTRPESLEEARRRWIRQFPEHHQQLSEIEFVPVNREDAGTVRRALLKGDKKNFDLVIHTAGPFQGKARAPNGVLEACVEAGVPYVDVCDDYCTSRAAQARYADRAVTQPCVLSTGCWPGVSSLMAAQLVSETLRAFPALAAEELSVDFSFFTAGSGGAGVTLLVATFLILAEKALVVRNGRRRSVDAMRSYSSVNFGPIVGDRDVAPLNLLETASIHDLLGVGSTCSRFGTAPDFWNALLGIMALLPPSVLENEGLMRRLSVFSLPIVRIVDAFAGATNAMRVDVTATAAAATSGKRKVRATAVYGHENLEPCVGECVAAFACAVLAGAVPPGVWFPEQAIRSGPDARAVLDLASTGAHTTLVETTGFDLAREQVWGDRISVSSPVADTLINEV